MVRAVHATARSPLAPDVLFVCLRNSCRSPMAESVARSLRGWTVASAGLQPRRRVDPMALHVLRERGLPVATLRSKGLTTEMADRTRTIVVLAGEQEHVGPLPSVGSILRWTVEDPLGWPRDVYEDALGDITAKVRLLHEEWLAARARLTAQSLELPLIPA